MRWEDDDGDVASSGSEDDNADEVLMVQQLRCDVDVVMMML